MKTLLLAFFILFNTASFADTSLYEAIRANQPEVVQAILDAGVDPNARLTKWTQWTGLQTAADVGSPEIIILLLEYGADPNHPYNFIPASHFAIESDCLYCLELLMEAEEHINGENLIRAHEEERWDIVEYLQSLGLES